MQHFSFILQSFDREIKFFYKVFVLKSFALCIEERLLIKVIVIKSKYKRVLLKLSGEVLMGNKSFGHDFEVVNRIASEIVNVHNLGIEICVVVGGGNIYRGSNPVLRGNGMEKASADYIGMLATIINALTMQSAIEGLGVSCRVLSAIPMATICEPYIRRKALRHLEKRRIIIFAGGTGNPFFTTDTAATLRSVEMGCDVLLKGTQVDGIYSDDPKVNKDSVKYNNITFDDVIKKNLKVMDTSAFSLARDHNMPIVVFSIKGENALLNALSGVGSYTVVSNEIIES
jgi:uridylate kinase